MTAEQTWVETRRSGDQWVVAAGGRWDIAAAPDLTAKLAAFDPAPPASAVRIDLSGLTALDTVGALLIERLGKRLVGEGHKVTMAGSRPDHERLIERIGAVDLSHDVTRPHTSHLVAVVERAGEATVAFGREAWRMLGFFGLLVTTLARIAVRPGRLRVTSLLFHMEHTGLDALPIVGLLSFLIGVVLGYQSASQLRQFGADVYVVNLLGVSILREIGILLTAIIIAGRSGSAFTAQIGTMKINEEVDALSTLGLDPVEVLVVPRLLALLLTLPLLAFYADVMGLFGGAAISYGVLGITFAQFIKQLHVAITPGILAVGLIKAPLFAFVIGMVGCYEGLKVTGSAESVGRLTTRSVVKAIFLVIVLDALCSILFSYFGV